LIAGYKGILVHTNFVVKMEDLNVCDLQRRILVDKLVGKLTRLFWIKTPKYLNFYLILI